MGAPLLHVSDRDPLALRVALPLSLLLLLPLALIVSGLGLDRRHTRRFGPASTVLDHLILDQLALR